MPQFNWEDPLDLTHLLTEEERAVQNLARKYSQDELLPGIVSAARDGHFNSTVMKQMGELGLLGSAITGYNCVGMSTVTYGLIARELERVDSSYRSALSVQSSLVMYPIQQFGTEDMKEEFLPKLATGDLIGCFGLTEPNHGSDPNSMESRAVPDGDTHYILNGSKTWITNSPIADIMIVWAKDEHDDIRGSLLDRAMEGISTPSIKEKLSFRASSTGFIMLSEAGDRMGVLGAAEECISIARQYTLDRHQFGAPLAANQLIQVKLADMLTELMLALHGCLRVSHVKDQGSMHPTQISLIKRNSCLKALSIARVCRDMLWANAISDEYHVMRHMVNLEAANTYEGTSDIHALIMGRSITGIKSFSK